MNPDPEPSPDPVLDPVLATHLYLSSVFCGI